MEFQTHFFLYFVLLSCFLSSSLAYNFYVGGRDGWVLYPSESYSHWAERNRFQVNDTLVFKYKKGTDSVLVVNKDDYYNCNTKNPIKKLEEGDSDFQFDRSGPFFFVTGKDQSCEKGQKLIVIVLAKAPAPGTEAPVSPKASPHAHSSGPALAPTSPSPVSNAPKASPASAPWSYGPAPASPPPTTTSSPAADSPTTPATEPGTPPGRLNSPAAAPSSSAWALTPTTTSVLVIFVTLALNVALSSALGAF
ncbi:hypothetical protein CIPAW_11G170700 [Carya illinoinensis]|uniref:Phytocyanin domain-containing protein n=1 Tax=Carya illinoinensis TaxID=32201 RepID=A0A8T1NYP2_CARIL|nr:hypothetical protein CIPAW_11G170700 [Carya illinoinensis]